MKNSKKSQKSDSHDQLVPQVVRVILDLTRNFHSTALDCHNSIHVLGVLEPRTQVLTMVNSGHHHSVIALFLSDEPPHFRLYEKIVVAVPITWRRSTFVVGVSAHVTYKAAKLWFPNPQSGIVQFYSAIVIDSFYLFVGKTEIEVPKN